jgi:hypothetical protein
MTYALLSSGSRVGELEIRSFSVSSSQFPVLIPPWAPEILPRSDLSRYFFGLAGRRRLLASPSGTKINHGEAMMGPILGLALLTLAAGVPFSIFQLAQSRRQAVLWIGLLLCFAPIPLFVVLIKTLFRWRGITP